MLELTACTRLGALDLDLELSVPAGRCLALAGPSGAGKTSVLRIAAGLIDVIGGEWLTEINVTSPTGIVAIERFDGTDVAGMIWDAIEAEVAARCEARAVTAP